MTPAVSNDVREAITPPALERYLCRFHNQAARVTGWQWLGGPLAVMKIGPATPKIMAATVPGN